MCKYVLFKNVGSFKFLFYVFDKSLMLTNAAFFW